MGSNTRHNGLDLDALIIDGCLGRRPRLSRAAAPLELTPPTPSASSGVYHRGRSLNDRAVAASFLGVANASDVSEGIGHAPAAIPLPGSLLHSRHQRTSFFFNSLFGKDCGDSKIGGVGSRVASCAQCQEQNRKCNSHDCAMYKGKCTEREVGGKWRMGNWYYYWGPSRPWIDNGDKIQYGQRVQVMGPGDGKKPEEMTEQDKELAKDEDKPWVDVYADGNMQYVQAKTLSNSPVGRRWIEPQFDGDVGQWVDDPPEPPSKVADIAKAEHMQAMLSGKIPPFVEGMMKPCDKLGRILDGSEDHTFCDDSQVCVTALPADFDKFSGNFCWKWVEPPCDQTPCQAPHWVNACKVSAGQPWCVPDHLIREYPGPIEIKCSATGPDVKKAGYANGCKWFEEALPREELNRLPGKIIRRYGQSGGRWFVSTGKDALSEKQAEDWILTGKLDLKSNQENHNSEFLARKPTADDEQGVAQGVAQGADQGALMPTKNVALTSYSGPRNSAVTL